MSTLGQDFADILGRDLAALDAQIARYPDDDSLWRVSGSIQNPAGTLVLHLMGNLQHYVGAGLGGSGYVRNRDLEFSDRGVSRDELRARIRACRDVVVPALEALSDEQVRSPYPGTLFPAMEGATTHRFLIHLSGHFMWHLGQVDYHRRLLADGPAA